MKEDEAALIIQTAFRRWSIQNYMKKEIYEEFERCEEECRIIEGFQRKQPLQKEVKKKEHLENMKNDKSIENEKRMELIEKLLCVVSIQSLDNSTDQNQFNGVNRIKFSFSDYKEYYKDQCNHATCLTDYKLKRRILFPSKNKLLPTKLRKRLNLLEINVENVIEKIRMNTTEWPYNGPPPVFKSNGCGNNWIKNLFDINYFLKKFMTKSSQNCCNNHDACYSTCGISRYDCDLEFLKCLETECMLSKNFSSTSCISAAVRMSHAVASNGCPNFIAAQTGSCECYHFKRMDNICEIHGDQLVPTTLPDDLMSYCIETSEAKEGLMNCHNNKQCRLVRDKKNHKIYCRCRFQCREKIIIRDISKMHLKSIKKVSSFRDIITNLFTDIFGKQRT